MIFTNPLSSLTRLERTLSNPVSGVCRRPTRLKDLLRPVRVSLGPVSILVSLTAGLAQLTSPLSQPLALISAVLVISLASLAGLVFRPDNNAVMELVRPLLDRAGLRLNYRDKVNCHAAFNSLVLIIAMFNVFLCPHL